MRSEKLKKLIKNKVPLKFRIKSEEQSKELQDFLFSHSIYWVDGDKIVCETHWTFLFLGYDDDYYLTLCHEDVEDCCFKPFEGKEFDLANDCLVEEDETIKRIKFNKTNLHIIEIEKILNKIKEDQ